MPERHRQASLLAAICLSIVACAESVPPPAPARAVVVEAPQPLAGPADGIALPGAIHARIEADLSFRVAGKLAERTVDMGAHVEPGTLLAVLDPQDARLNLAAARAALAAAEADLELAQAEERRHRQLRERGFVGQSPLDVRINATRLAAARVTQSRAELELAANQSRYTHLRADAAGVILQILAEPGNVLSAGQPVVRFAADGEREVHVSVPEGRLEALRAAPLLAVEVLNKPGHRYRGRVRDIDPQADAATRTHRARVTLVDADAAVQLGATATVIVAAFDDGKSYRLPATALGALDAGSPVVWRLRGTDGAETVEPVPVEVLRYYDGVVAVSGPLSADDRVVSAGVHLLSAGMRVQAIDRAGKAAL